MINSIEDISQLSIVVVLYRAGLSGEFLSHALTQSIDNMTQTTHFWENNNRCKYLDVFDRNLNSGFDTIDHHKLIQGVNLYLKQNKAGNTTHIATAHPHPSSIKFLQENLPLVPVIEVTARNILSKKFVAFATTSKIKHKPTALLYNPLLVQDQSNCTFSRHLLVEWQDIIITDPAPTFDKISQFIGHSGNADNFCSYVADYRNRNADLIKLANES
jgi:hypothetical protein